jgi:polyisoprenoid-binding protein YceI
MTKPEGMMRTNVGVVAALLVCMGSVGASGNGSKTYDFKDPKSLNSIVLVLDSPLEPMMAVANGVSGTLEFDPAMPKRSTGRIVIDAGSVQFPNPGVAATARGPDGFDVERFPTIEFVMREVKNARMVSPSVYAGTVVGDFICRGVTKRMNVEATVTHLPGKAALRHRSGGDLVVLRSTFRIHRRDFGIKPRNGDSLLAEDVEVRVAIAGASS